MNQFILPSISNSKSRSSVICNQDTNKIYVWGENDHGQLGLGNIKNENSPVEFPHLKASEVLVWRFGYEFGVAATRDKRFLIWGNFDSNDILSPIEVGTLQGKTVSAVTCGRDFVVCACDFDDHYSWGQNTNGQLGLGHERSLFAPQPILPLRGQKNKFLSSGPDFVVCCTLDHLYSWGVNTSGQLGKSAAGPEKSPILIPSLKSSNILNLACGAAFVLCLTTQNLFSWGENSDRQCDPNNSSSKIESPTPISWINSSQIRGFSCGCDHSIAWTDEKVYAWGGNDSGQLGNTENNEISDLKGIKIQSIMTGSKHNLCICDLGVISWGWNCAGQLGRNQVDSREISFFSSFFSSALFFPPSCLFNSTRSSSILLMCLSRLFLPEDSLFGEEYLPWDLFRVLIQLI